MTSKIMQKEEVLDRLSRHRAAGDSIVFTNGCFDLLHVGHLRYLTQAKALGDVLVVGINSDLSVARLKGESRPLVKEDERAEMLLGLKAVDFVCIFDQDTPLELIKEVRPDVLTKGGDWPVEKIVGAEFVKSIGGKTLSLPFVEGRSTSSLVEKILQGSV